MSSLPKNIRRIHFVGIGGIGMSGIAEILHRLGYNIQGSDVSENANVQRLRSLGIPIAVGHKRDNIGEAQAVVVSTAVKADNPELIEATQRYVPIVHRSEMLAEIMRNKNTVAVAGTHGKTTTTSLIATIFEAAKTNPTVVNGGIINTYESNARHGDGDWVIAEADESDGSFLRLPTTFGIVTNIDPEHLDHYKSFDILKAAFKTFIDKIPFYGLGVLCTDHPVVRDLVQELGAKRVVTYGLQEGAEVRAVNIRMAPEGSTFDVEMKQSPVLLAPVWSSKRDVTLPYVVRDIFLPMVGMHNIQNSLAAVAISQEMGFSEVTLREAFASFEGVKRRFTKTGETNGVTIIDDYAHHPVEIRTVLQAAKQAAQGKVIAVVQPHRYSRLQSLFEEFCMCFEGCDQVFVAPVYPAGESPIDGVNATTLAEGIKKTGLDNVSEIEGEEDLPENIMRVATPGDLVICLGAGNITHWAVNLPEKLDQLSNSRA